MAKSKAEARREEALKSWKACNDFLREANELAAYELLEMEKSGKRRTQYMLRIHARFNVERSKRERSELFKED